MGTSEKNEPPWKWWLNGFTSLKLTIALLILLALVSIVGTLIKQNLSEAEYLRRYSVTTYRILKTSGCLDLYHAWWFVLLLGILCVNLFACSLKNFPRIWKAVANRNPLLTDDLMKKGVFVSTLKKNLSLEQAKEKVTRVLAKDFSSPQQTVHNGSVHFYSERARYARLGVFITHASVVIILLGGLIGSLWGFKGRVAIAEGTREHRILLQKGKVYELPFAVQCDDFEVTYYPTGAPKDYKSTLSIVEQGNVVFTKTIEVNHPLQYRGLTFYQSEFGEVADLGGKVMLLVKQKDAERPGRVFRVAVGESFELPEAGLSVKVNRFFSDFLRGEDGVVINRSFAFNNPAVELLVYKGEELQARTWVFQKFPDFHGSRGEYRFFLQDIATKQYTVLQVTKDPGVNVVWLGCSLLVLGILATFFFFHQQVWIRITSRANRLEIAIAGSTSKNQIAFEKVFEKLKTAIAKI